RMIPAEISGIAFTADPVTQHRHVCAIDASYGLGEALVSGLVNADNYRVDRWTGEVLQTRVGDKAIAIRPLPGGGTQTEDVSPADRERLALNDSQITELVALVGRVEAHYGCPQDLEWCLEKGVFYLVQSRAITSLFPLPKSLLRRPGEPLRVFISFGHIQVNTAPFPRLSHAIFRRVLPIGKPTVGAGYDEQSTIVTAIAGRVFIDATPALSRFPTSVVIPKVIGNMDAVIAGRLRTVCSRPSFRRGPRKQRARVRALTSFGLPVMLRAQLFLWWYKPARAFESFERLKVSVASVVTRARAEHPPGVERLRAATTAVAKLCGSDLLQAHPTVPAAGLMAWKLLEWFMAGKVEPGTTEALTRGLSGNVTTEMDLELGDLADLARGTPLAKILSEAPPKLAIEKIRALGGTEVFIAAWDRFIATYGARCPGEIDFSVPRWREDPSSLVTSLAGMLHGSEPGHHRRRESEAREQAKAAGETLERTAFAVLGRIRGRLVRRLIICIRTYMGLREHGKFYMIQAFDELRKISLECGQVGVERGVFESAEDAFSFDFDELEQALDDSSKIEASHWRETAVARRNELRSEAVLRVPAVLTNDGEIPPMPVAADLPPGVLAGQGVSSGVVEGVARVITDPTTEVLLAGEILVAPFTDPGWTPLFVHAAGLVMEVGGLMTHGSVVAREYGIPAVVSVESALSRIKTGDTIRVDGEKGWVKILKPFASTTEEGLA
ncbi:MAG: PEP/pyruvate-binding domain-containing protein, partial [Nannocystaceae bacterium]